MAAAEPEAVEGEIAADETDGPEEQIWVSVARRVAAVKAEFLLHDENDIDPATHLMRVKRVPLEAPMTVGAFATLQRIGEDEALTNEAEIGTWLLWFEYHQYGGPPFKDMPLIDFANGVDSSTVELKVLRRGGDVPEMMDPKAPSNSQQP